MKDPVDRKNLHEDRRHLDRGGCALYRCPAPGGLILRPADRGDVELSLRE